jgi:transposase-like protein
MMRRSQAEKIEIIHLVEHSDLSISRTLDELDVPRSTFYRWYQRYQEEGLDGVADHKPRPRQFWNRIPDIVRDQVVQFALENPDKSSRQLAWHITDTEGYFISESSVYRILKGYDLISSPVFQMVSAKDKYEKPTKRVNELWQTDFTYLKVQGWGWYYLSTVLDDYSRYILAWKLCKTMGARDVEDTLEIALAKTDIDRVKVRHRPRLLSDNGPCYLSGELKKYLKRKDIDHIRGAPYHPMTQGKIERYHRSMKNVIKLLNYEYPGELEQAIDEFVKYYNKQRYHEALDNLTPEDVYLGREKVVQTRREKIKEATLRHRRKWNLGTHTGWPWTLNPKGEILS